MTFIHVLVKKGSVKHKYMHWRDAIALFENNFKICEGRKLEIIVIDLDNHRITSSQSCFNLMNLPATSIQKVLTEFDYEESSSKK